MNDQEIKRATEVEQVQSLCWPVLAPLIKQYGDDVIIESLQWFIDLLQGHKQWLHPFNEENGKLDAM